MQLTWRPLNIFDINSRDYGVRNVVKGLILLIGITYIIVFHDDRCSTETFHAQQKPNLFPSCAIEYISYCPDSQMSEKKFCKVSAINSLDKMPAEI